MIAALAAVSVAATDTENPTQETNPGTGNFHFVLTTDPFTAQAYSGTAPHLETLADDLRETWQSWIVATLVRPDSADEPELEVWIRVPNGADTSIPQQIREDVAARASAADIPQDQIQIEETPYLLEDAGHVALAGAATIIGELDAETWVELTIDPAGVVQAIASTAPDEIQARIQGTTYQHLTVQPMAAPSGEPERQRTTIWEAYLRMSRTMMAIFTAIVVAGLIAAILTARQWWKRRQTARRAWPWAAASLVALGISVFVIYSVIDYLHIVHIYG